MVAGDTLSSGSTTSDQPSWAGPDTARSRQGGPENVAAKSAVAVLLLITASSHRLWRPSRATTPISTHPTSPLLIPVAVRQIASSDCPRGGIRKITRPASDRMVYLA